MKQEPVLEVVDATVIKGDRPVLDGLTLTIRSLEHTAIVGPNGAGKSVLVNLLTHQDRAVAKDDGAAAIRVFGNDNWNVFELRSQLGIISADLHQRFVNGNNEGRILAEAAVLSGFLASHGDSSISRDQSEMASAPLKRWIEWALDLARRRLDEMSTASSTGLAGAALVTAPRALVLDEPTTGWD